MYARSPIGEDRTPPTGVSTLTEPQHNPEPLARPRHGIGGTCEGIRAWFDAIRHRDDDWAYLIEAVGRVVDRAEDVLPR